MSGSGVCWPRFYECLQICKIYLTRKSNHSNIQLYVLNAHADGYTSFTLVLGRFLKYQSISTFKIYQHRHYRHGTTPVLCTIWWAIYTKWTEIIRHCEWDMRISRQTWRWWRAALTWSTTAWFRVSSKSDRDILPSCTDLPSNFGVARLCRTSATESAKILNVRCWLSNLTKIPNSIS